ncbi:hypothetical protein JW835_04760 [bacterium]|nr:hypothetical protein [bacterium]RQV97219.1 MAG: hypothetical protein EH221_04075 [bacterium]
MSFIKQNRNSLILVSLLFISVIMKCNDSKNIIGITETDENGALIGKVDNNDWCPPNFDTNEFNIPSSSGLYPAYPNPTNIRTSIHYALSEMGQIKILITLKRNRIIRTLVDEMQAPGEYIVIWDLMDENKNLVENGIYQASLHVNEIVICSGDIKVKY